MRKKLLMGFLVPLCLLIVIVGTIESTTASILFWNRPNFKKIT